MPMFKRGCVVLLAILASTCGSSSGTPTTPTPPTSTATRIIGLNGNLGFGTVLVGSKATTTLTITNSGNATLSVTGMSGPSGYTANWTSGPISAGGSQSLTISFTPTAAIGYGGTLTVNGDQTSGTNAAPMSGTGVAPTVTPSTFTLNGTLTDGTSHGILPNITVQIVSGTNVGKSTVTDSGGNYAMSGLSAGTFTLAVSATGYLTTTQQLTLSANARVDLVLQRVGSPNPTPTPTPPPTPVPVSPSCNGRAVPAIVACLNNQGFLPPTAQCVDGAYSCSETRSGTCSTHGGVSCYVCPGPICQ
jgi:Carboxypeptidase regulatory-like domain/Abnormal spindle-like microcephaly-assoc'd, ASPM-SPD-2-Hydin/Protein of unknown function (DUF3761)